MDCFCAGRNLIAGTVMERYWPCEATAERGRLTLNRQFIYLLKPHTYLYTHTLTLFG